MFKNFYIISACLRQICTDSHGRRRGVALAGERSVQLLLLESEPCSCSCWRASRAVALAGELSVQLLLLESDPCSCSCWRAIRVAIGPSTLFQKDSASPHKAYNLWTSQPTTGSGRTALTAKTDLRKTFQERPARPAGRSAGRMAGRPVGRSAGRAQRRTDDVTSQQTSNTNTVISR